MAFRGSHGTTLAGAFVLLVICLFSPNNISAGTTPPKGFSLKLIPKYSIESPMYPSNLTKEERYDLMVELSKKRALRLSAELDYAIANTETTNGSTFPDVLTPKVEPAFDSAYVAELDIGTPPQPFFLELDTGGELIWLQCAGCTECFGLNNGRNYEYFKSNTYEYVSCDHPLCDTGECDMGRCKSKASYGDDSFTKGFLSTDNFRFHSLDNIFQIVNGVYFGCSLESRMNWAGRNNGPANRIAGIFGMSLGPQSFISQLGAHGQGRFSYCLKKLETPGRAYSFLRFGEDAFFPPGSIVDTTPMVRGKFDFLYHVNVIDISVNYFRLLLPPKTFRIRRDGGGGAILDTGSTTNFINRDAYNRLVERLKLVFYPYNLQQLETDMLCYVRPLGFNNFPLITFHFEGADFDLWPEIAFLISNDYFCLEMLPIDRGATSIIGSFSQTDRYFVHDIVRRTISFARADCSQ